ncbi:MAG: hydroxymethylglutaryl-CoA synthase [Deltaproteobacteria bacterium]|nr:hydroxymethylglutaryl-CoA synthase [Deltaproteobacteria bacterium]
MHQEKRFGVEGIAVSIPKHFIDLGTLAEATGVDPAKYYRGLGGRRMAVVTPIEDPVTMAVEATRTLIDRYDVDPSGIGMLIVGSESGVDAAKPIASYVHGMLGLAPHCRTFDTQHACYGATAALQMARDWTSRQVGEGKKAIVVATDIARYEVGSAGEPTQGAGAVALLVGNRPDVLVIENHDDAVYTADVMDFWRPHYSSTAMVDGHYSLECYLKALENTYLTHRAASGLGWDDYRHLLFHVPFPKMAFKAFRQLHEIESKERNGDFGPLEEQFDRMTAPALWANIEVGNVYSASLYLSFAGLLEKSGHDLEGARLGFFSYGSGCCAEFFSGTVGTDASAWQGRIGVAEALAGRIELDYDQYLELRKETEAISRDGSYRERPASNGEHVWFCGVQGHQRIYARAM